MGCPFCNFDKEIRYRLMTETEHFYLFPAIGAFEEGYVLISSKEHVVSLVTIPPKQLAEIHHLETMAENFLGAAYKKPIIKYEHGANPLGNEKAGCCLDHFHLHITVTNKDVLAAVSGQLGKGKTASSYSELVKLYQQHKFNSYLMINNKKITYWENPLIISQYMRRILINQKQRDKFDWHFHPYKNNLERCYKKWLAWNKKNLC